MDDTKQSNTVVDLGDHMRSQTVNQRDAEGSALFNRIMEQIHDINKARRGLTPKSIYIGMKEFDTLRAWSDIHRWHHMSPHGDTLAGLPYYKVSNESHLYIVWE